MGTIQSSLFPHVVATQRSIVTRIHGMYYNDTFFLLQEKH
jgi:hypothetical protein